MAGYFMLLLYVVFILCLGWKWRKHKIEDKPPPTIKDPASYKNIWHN